MKHLVIGHQKPDLDATVAAIAQAEFLRQKGYADVVAHITEPVNPETQFIFDKLGLVPPPVLVVDQITPEDTVTLVDHNEEEQRLPGINPEQIIGIVDHHKINLNLTHPIAITIKPVGSTNTIIYHHFKKHSLTIDQKLATLMLCAILSDTVGLKSSTTVNKDKEAATELAALAKITDLDAMTLEIFKAKSNISALTPEQIVKNDYKVFDFAKKTFIGQLETVEQQLVLTDRKAALLEAMAKVKQAEGVELIFLAITDILAINTKLLILSDAEKMVAEKAFGGATTDSVLDIGAKMSRKKDIAPPIEEALKN